MYEGLNSVFFLSRYCPSAGPAAWSRGGALISLLSGPPTTGSHATDQPVRQTLHFLFQLLLTFVHCLSIWRYCRLLLHGICQYMGLQSTSTSVAVGLVHGDIIVVVEERWCHRVLLSYHNH